MSGSTVRVEQGGHEVRSDDIHVAEQFDTNINTQSTGGLNCGYRARGKLTPGWSYSPHYAYIS